MQNLPDSPQQGNLPPQQPNNPVQGSGQAAQNVPPTMPSAPQSPSQNTPGPVPNQEIDTEAGKKSSKKKLFFLIFVLVAAAGVATYITLAGQGPPPQPKDPVVVNEPVTPEPSQQQWETHVNRQFEFTFIYPKEATFVETNPFSNSPSMYRAIYDPENDFSQVEDKSTINEKSIGSGYSFSVTINKGISTKEIDEVVESKRRLYRAECPNFTRISSPIKLEISTYPARKFKVENCEGEYDVTYIKREPYFYEITEFSKGDVGYRESYEALTMEMFNNFKLTNVVEPLPKTQWIPYENKDYKFTLLHPNLNTTCCNISGPLTLEEFPTPKKHRVFADESTVTEDLKDKPFDGFALYTVGNTKRGVQFNDYLEKQKAALIEDYKVVVGKEPSPKQSSIVVGNREGVYLRGYAWWGELIMVPLPETNSVLVISKTDMAEDTFDATFAEILQTFEFSDAETTE